MFHYLLPFLSNLMISSSPQFLSFVSKDLWIFLYISVDEHVQLYRAEFLNHKVGLCLVVTVNIPKMIEPIYI